MALAWNRIRIDSRYLWLHCEFFAASRPMEFKMVTEAELDEVGAWCRDNNCGQRMSFDQFRFRTEAEVTAFLLRWG